MAFEEKSRRRKKINVLHAVGPWEGKIEDCNCPSCKEVEDEEKNAAESHKKNLKKKKSGKKQKKYMSVIVCVDSEGEILSNNSNDIIKQIETIDDGHSEIVSVQVLEDCENNLNKANINSLDSNSVNKDQTEILNENNSKEIISNIAPSKNVSNNNHSQSNSNHLPNKKKRGRPKSSSPGVSKPKLKKEQENIYAKPRLVFTGQNVIKSEKENSNDKSKSVKEKKSEVISSNNVIKIENIDNSNENLELIVSSNKSAAIEQQSVNVKIEKPKSKKDDSSVVDDSDLDDEEFDFEDEDDENEIRPKKKQKISKPSSDSSNDGYAECEICFKTLKETSMKQHYKTHTGLKPFNCSECNARFTRRGDVQRHRKLIHLKVKPYQCCKCNKEFTDKRMLKFHLQNHDKASYYSCNTCGFKFGKREYYENHIRYIHPLPDGVEPNFSLIEKDKSFQLNELEIEEKAMVEEVNLPSIKYKSENDEPDEDKSLNEINNIPSKVENNIKIKEEKKEELDLEANILETDIDDNGQIVSKVTSNSSIKETNIIKDTIIPLSTKTNSFDQAKHMKMKLVKGTVSLTQTISDSELHDDDLVNKAINAAVNQATATLQSMQSVAANMAQSDKISNYDEEDDDDYDDDEDEDELDDEPEFISNELNNVIEQNEESGEQNKISIPQESTTSSGTEIHINASIGGQPRNTFIIQVPAGSNFNAQTPEGMDMIVSMVNQICAGKGELDGPVEVVMQNGITSTQVDI